MDVEISKQDKASIIYLFEKMDSNVSKFRDSINSSPTNHQTYRNSHQFHQSSDCSCLKENKNRQLERDFYLHQQQLVYKASQLLQSQGNITLSKLLNFMYDFLVKISEELKNQLVCVCKQRKIIQNEDLHHKINFLREQNHKFFRMIEQKSEQCDKLNNQIQALMSQLSKNIETESYTPIAAHLKSSIPLFSAVTEQLSSRAISSNSSRISEFRHVWPELTMPMGDVGHRKYFEGHSQRDNHFRQGLFQKDTNCQFQNTFRKTKIFQPNPLIK